MRERDEEIKRLREELEKARAARTASSPAPSAADDELAGALESALVRQGGRVLPRRTYELEPEISYFYDEPTTGQRRDTWNAALTARAGLGSGWQAELTLPYVIQDKWTNVGTSSGVGDVRLGLVKELLAEREGRPALLAFGRWRTTTGDIDKRPPTGFGQDAVHLGLSVAKRQDPVVLFGSLSYTENLGSAHLASGSRYSWGNALGARLGAYLAATPDTSLYSAVSISSAGGDRFNGMPVPDTNRLTGVLELGSASVIGRGKFLNITASLGFTPAAPRFGLAVSLPIRFQ